MDPNTVLKQFWHCIDAGDADGARQAHEELSTWMELGGCQPRWESLGQREMFTSFNKRRGECDMRNLLLPDAASFWDVFQAWTKNREDVAKGWIAAFPFEDYTLRTGARQQAKIPIRPYCSLNRSGEWGGSLYVRAHEHVLNLVRDNMIAAGVSDNITWKITVRKGDYSLISTTNSIIIGGAWVAIVDTGTLPDIKAWPGGVAYAPSDEGDLECCSCGRRYWSGDGSQHEAKCTHCEAL